MTYVVFGTYGFTNLFFNICYGTIHEIIFAFSVNLCLLAGSSSNLLTIAQKINNIMYALRKHS